MELLRDSLNIGPGEDQSVRVHEIPVNNQISLACSRTDAQRFHNLLESLVNVEIPPNVSKISDWEIGAAKNNLDSRARI